MKKNVMAAGIFLSIFLLFIASSLTMCTAHSLATTNNSSGIDDLEFKLKTDKTTYEEGERVDITGFFTNTGTEVLKITFPSLLAYDIHIKDTEGIYVYDDYGHRLKPWNRTFKPGDTMTFGCYWTQLNNIGKSVDVGNYSIMGCAFVIYKGTEYRLTDSAPTIEITEEKSRAMPNNFLLFRFLQRFPVLAYLINL